MAVIKTSYLLLVLLVSAWLPARAQDAQGDSTADECGEADKCEPSEAETCFANVSENLLCHVKPAKNKDCNLKTAQDLCTSLDEALNCTSDVIDCNCSENDGKLVFDNWLAGLRAIYKRLCTQGNYTLVSTLLDNTRCWNAKTFFNCVENKANLTHMSDLLTTNLDQHECNILLMSVSVCNDKAEKNGLKCRGTFDAVNEAMAAFFKSSVCSGSTPDMCNVLKPINSPQTSPSPSSSSPTGAIFLTLFVTVVIFVLTALFLVWRNVITVNARFRIPKSNVEGVGESSEDYGRFL